MLNKTLIICAAALVVPVNGFLGTAAAVYAACQALCATTFGVPTLMSGGTLVGPAAVGYASCQAACAGGAAVAVVTPTP